MNFPILTLITFIPLLGAILLLFIPKENEKAIRWTAVVVSLIPLALSVVVWAGYNPKVAGGMAWEELYEWIPAIGVRYHMGVDGISIPMVFLTALLTPLSLVYSFIIKDRVKEYFIFFLLLEVGMMGVFVALDFFLFYLFWEVSLVPMYFLIGIWGGPRREYAAIKFFLYTLVGSVAMLLAILAIYFNTGAKTFDIIAAGADAALLRRLADAVPGLLGLLHRLRHQGARVAVPHVAARRPRGGAHRGQRDPGRRPAEAGLLRHVPHPPAHLPRRRPGAMRR